MVISRTRSEISSSPLSLSTSETPRRAQFLQLSQTFITKRRHEQRLDDPSAASDGLWRQCMRFSVDKTAIALSSLRGSAVALAPVHHVSRYAVHREATLARFIEFVRTALPDRPAPGKRRLHAYVDPGPGALRTKKARGARTRRPENECGRLYSRAHVRRITRERVGYSAPPRAIKPGRARGTSESTSSLAAICDRAGLPFFFPSASQPPPPER